MQETDDKKLSLEELIAKQKIEDLYVMLTNVPQNASTVMHTGYNTVQILSDAFDAAAVKGNAVVLPGVISRKKQFLPALMAAYQQL